MFTPPPLLAAEPLTSSPKRRRVECGVEENKDPNISATSLSSEQRSRIEQNRLAALERKQQKDALTPGDQEAACTSDINAEKRARIEQNRLAALARKQQKAVACEQQVLSSPDQDVSGALDIDAQKRARIELSRLAALARKQQKAGEVAGPTEELPEQKQKPDVDASSSAPPTPSFSSAPSTPSSESLLCADDIAGSSSTSDVSSNDSDSASERSSSSSSSSESTSSSSSGSDSDAEQHPGSSSPRPTPLTPAQAAKIAYNRRAALARKNGVTPEQFERIEANRRAAMARKRGFDPEQIARMEASRRKAMERKQQIQNAAEEVLEKKTDTSKADDVKEEFLANGVAAPKPVEERDARQKLVAQLLCRWWYALPAWPPENFDYGAELAKLRFRSTPMVTFDQEVESDERGFRKCYELAAYKGCFRTSDGNLLDVRPVQGRPSYDQMMLKSLPDLYKLLLVAFDGQLQELFAETQKPGASSELEEHLVALRKQASQVRQKAMFFLQFAPKKKGAAKS